MQQTDAVIERVWQVAKGCQRVELIVDQSLDNIQVGQSLLALDDAFYLRRQWLPVARDGRVLTIELPQQTSVTPGQVIDIIAPVGQPYPWVGGANKRLLLIAQETLPTPLLWLAQEAVNQSAEVAMVLLGTASNYPFEGIPPAVEVMVGEDDGTWKDEDSLLTWADQVFMVVHPAFWLDYFTTLFHKMKNTRGHVPVNLLYGVMNIPLPCGTGACNACMVRCKTKNKLACTDGTALDLTEVQLL